MAVEGADEKPGLGETRFDVRDHGPVFFPEAGEPGVEVLPGSRSAPFRGVPFGVVTDRPNGATPDRLNGATWRV